MQIYLPDIFSYEECLWFLDRGFSDCSHTIVDRQVRKIFAHEGQKALVELSFISKKLIADVLVGDIPEDILEKNITQWLGLETDLAPFYSLLKKDSDLSFLALKYKGLRAIGIPDFFETICWSIIGQQINLTFAYKLKKALSEAVADKIQYEDCDYYLFPRPGSIANISDEAFKNMQFSKQKVNYIRGIAECILDGSLDEKEVWKLNSNIERVNYLKSFKGIGEWTAQYVLLKYFKDPSAAMYGDAGLNQVLYLLKDIPKKDSRAQQEDVYAQFEGWESYLTFYLWRHLSGL